MILKTYVLSKTTQLTNLLVRQFKHMESKQPLGTFLLEDQLSYRQKLSHINYVYIIY